MFSEEFYHELDATSGLDDEWSDERRSLSDGLMPTLESALGDLYIEGDRL